MLYSAAPVQQWVMWNPAMTTEERLWVQELLNRHREHSLVFAWIMGCRATLAARHITAGVISGVEVVKGRHGILEDEWTTIKLLVRLPKPNR